MFSASVLTLTACNKQPAQTENTATTKDKTESVRTIKLVSTGSDTDVWKYVATLPETKEAGIKLQVTNLTDYVVLNTSVANGEQDVNAFQSFNYLAAYNASNTAKVAAIATTYLEPMGIYADKLKLLKSSHKARRLQFQTILLTKLVHYIITIC